MAAAPMLRRVVLPCTVTQGKLSHKLESGCSPGFWVILDGWIPHPPGQEGLPWLSAGLLMGVVNGDKMKWFIKQWWPWWLNAVNSGAPPAGSLARTELCALLLPERKPDGKQTQPWGWCASESLPRAASGSRTNKVPADSFSKEAFDVTVNWQ